MLQRLFGIRQPVIPLPPLVALPVAEARAVALYDGEIEALIKRAKYKGDRRAVARLARLMTAELRRSTWTIAYVTAVPMHADKLKRRGYNQAELLARAISRAVRVPYADMLVKTRKTPSQTKLGRHRRAANVAGAFDVLRVPTTSKSVDRVLGWDYYLVDFPYKLTGKNVLIVDDVWTTGSTVRECATVLLKYNAAKVYALTASRAANPSGQIRDVALW
jgi:predicted amidophosphoribosyltransferase